jgi:hypothetical protein
LVAVGNAVVIAAMVINIPLAVYLIKILQFTSYLTFINIIFPKNLSDFLEYFNINIFAFLTWDPINSDTLGCASRNKFDYYKEECSIINSSWIIFSQIFILSIAKLIVSAMAKSDDLRLANEKKTRQGMIQ